MEKTVAAFLARRWFGKMLQEVTVNGDRFVVERHGEPVAAVVPIEVYTQWKRARGEFFAGFQSVAERANVPAREAELLAEQAIRAVRVSQ